MKSFYLPPLSAGVIQIHFFIVCFNEKKCLTFDSVATVTNVRNSMNDVSPCLFFSLFSNWIKHFLRDFLKILHDPVSTFCALQEISFYD